MVTCLTCWSLAWFMVMKIEQDGFRVNSTPKELYRKLYYIYLRSIFFSAKYLVSKMLDIWFMVINIEQGGFRVISTLGYLDI